MDLHCCVFILLDHSSMTAAIIASHVVETDSVDLLSLSRTVWAFTKVLCSWESKILFFSDLHFFASEINFELFCTTSSFLFNDIFFILYSSLIRSAFTLTRDLYSPFVSNYVAISFLSSNLHLLFSKKHKKNGTAAFLMDFTFVSKKFPVMFSTQTFF